MTVFPALITYIFLCFKRSTLSTLFYKVHMTLYPTSDWPESMPKEGIKKRKTPVIVISENLTTFQKHVQ